MRSRHGGGRIGTAKGMERRKVDGMKHKREWE